MPVTIPEWLKAPDVGADYARGLQIGAQVADARARLDVQRQDTQLRAQVAQQDAEQQRALEQQRIATTAAYQQQQIQLRRQQLDQVKAMNDQKTANAARQLVAKQQWQTGFAKIDADQTMSPEQKDAAKTSLTMSLAPTMGMGGTEAASMLRDMRPPKATVPASVDTNAVPGFAQITQPGGNISLVRQPPPAKPSAEPNVKIRLNTTDPPVTMNLTQALATWNKLPPDVQNDPVNESLRAMLARKPAASVAPTPTDATASVANGTKIRVKKGGKTYLVPSENLEEALKRGYERVQ